MRSSKLLYPSLISLAVGIFLTEKYSIAFVYSVPLLLFFIFLFIFSFYKRSNNFSAISVLIVIFFTGSVLTQARKTDILNKELKGREKGISYIQGEVLRPPEKHNENYRFEIRISKINNKRKRKNRQIKALVIFNPFKSGKSSLDLKPGMVIEFPGLVLPVDSPSTPWEFDYKKYLNINGISGLIYLPAPQAIKLKGKKNPGFIDYIIFNSREKLKTIIDKSLPPPESNLMKGILLGKRKELSKELEISFRRAGTIHILAASGLHISIVIAFFVLFFRLLKINDKLVYLLTVIPVIFYALLAGSSPSIIRASIMGVLFLLVLALEKDYNPLRSLFFSAFIMLLINPYYLFSAGFQLSFIAVAGILFLYPLIFSFLPQKKQVKSYLEKFLPKKIAATISSSFHYILATIVISISAQTAITPILAYYFNEISVVNLPSNIIMVPLTGVILPLGFIGGVLGMISSHLGQFILVFSYLPLKFCILAARLLGNSSFSTFTVPSPSFVFFLFWYGFLLTISLKTDFFKKNRLNIVIVLLTMASISIFVAAKKLNSQKNIIFFDSVLSRTILIEDSGKQVLIILPGDKYPGKIIPEIKLKVLTYLKKKGISRIDGAVLFLKREKDSVIYKDMIQEKLARNIILTGKPGNKETVNGVEVLNPFYSDIFSGKEDYSITLKDSKVTVFGCEDRREGLLSYEWEWGYMLYNIPGNFLSKGVYNRKKLINNLILIREKLPLDTVLIKELESLSPGKVYILDLSKNSIKKIKDFKNYLYLTTNEKNNRIRDIYQKTLILDISSNKINQVNFSKKKQEK